MAVYYWVGGSGTWNAVSTANWASTSGGASGAGVPTTADAVIFDAASGSGTVTLGSNVFASYCYSNLASNIIFTGNGYKLSLSANNNALFLTSGTITSSDGMLLEATYTGSVGTRQFILLGSGENNAFSVSVTGGSDIVAIGSFVKNVSFGSFSGTFTNAARTIYGNISLSSTMTFAAGAQVTTIAATSGPKTITSNGAIIDCPLHINGVGGSWSLVDNFALGATRQFRLINGTFDANGKNVSIGDFISLTGTQTLNIGSGTWNVQSAGWSANIAGLTVAPSSGRINMASSTAKVFAGGGKTWPTLNQGGAGALTIQQSNGFANITNTVQPATITLTAGTTQTVGAFGVSGTAGNLITLNTSSAGTRATLTDTGGTNEVSFVSIKDINATGGAVWSAYLKEGNIDAGNNLGWDFFPAVRQIFRQVFSSIFRPIF